MFYLNTSQSLQCCIVLRCLALPTNKQFFHSLNRTQYEWRSFLLYDCAHLCGVRKKHTHTKPIEWLCATCSIRFTAHFFPSLFGPFHCAQLSVELISMRVVLNEIIFHFLLFSVRFFLCSSNLFWFFSPAREKKIKLEFRSETLSYSEKKANISVLNYGFSGWKNIH